MISFPKLEYKNVAINIFKVIIRKHSNQLHILKEPKLLKMSQVKKKVALINAKLSHGQVNTLFISSSINHLLFYLFLRANVVQN